MASLVTVEEKDSKMIDVTTTDSAEVRRMMKAYWDRWAGDTTESGTSLELMVGERKYSDALTLHEMDSAEVLNLIPDVTGMEVLELGGGTGRLSGELAKKAKHVIASDFIESFVKENEETNGPKYPNMSFRVLDASKLDYPTDSFDFIFTNWLLMYLNDQETAQFTLNVLKMLKPGGYIFFRESHFRAVGSRPQAINPTMYRSLKAYYDYFTKARFTDNQNITYFFEFVRAGNCQTYIKRKGNPTQIHYLWRKMPILDEPSVVSIQQALDDMFYNEGCRKVYNEVIGDGFVTAGGLKAAQGLLSKLELKPGAVVLDVGCGLGGLATYLTQEFDVNVTGMELSVAASEAAILRANESELKKGNMIIADITQFNFAPNTFDAIYVKETLQYYENKQQIYTKLQRWLRTSGTMVVGDFCLGEDYQDDDIAVVLDNEQLQLITIETYTELLKDVGFSDMSIEDCSTQYSEYLQKDLNKLQLLEDIPAPIMNQFTVLWHTLLAALKAKKLSWVTIVATK